MAKRTSAYPVALSGLLLSMMLVLGYLESLLPTVGVPGIKLGLSNGVLIFAVCMLDIPTAYILMALKVLLSGLMFGGVSAMMYAFAGGLLSLTGMVLLSRLPKLSRVLVSMAGGMLHNIGQVTLAMILLRTPRQMLYYMGLLSLVGLACGALTGVVADSVIRHLGRIGWKAQAERRSGLVPVLISVIVVAAVGVWAWTSLPRVSPAGVTVTVQQGTPELLELDQLPLAP